MAGLISGGEHSTLRPASLLLYPSYPSSRLGGGRQASIASISVGVYKKQFVVHLWTFCQKLDTVRMVCAERAKTSPP